MPEIDGDQATPERRLAEPAPERPAGTAARELRLACLLCRVLAAACAGTCTGAILAGAEAAPLLTIAVLAAIVAVSATGNSARS